MTYDLTTSWEIENLWNEQIESGKLGIFGDMYLSINQNREQYRALGLNNRRYIIRHYPEEYVGNWWAIELSSLCVMGKGSTAQKAFENAEKPFIDKLWKKL